MNARLPICLLTLAIALPLAVAGCGNSGPLVMPDAAPVDTGVDADADADNQMVDPVDLDEVEAPVADPIPDVDTDDGNG